MTEAIATYNRQVAANKWAVEFAESRQNKPPSKDPKTRALAVVVLTDTTRDWLAEHDPMALKQAQEALNGKSYCDYLKIAAA